MSEESNAEEAQQTEGEQPDAPLNNEGEATEAEQEDGTAAEPEASAKPQE